MPQFVECTINIVNDASSSVNGACRSMIDDYRVTLRIVAYNLQRVKLIKTVFLQND